MKKEDFEFYGATDAQESMPALKWRDTRPNSYKFKSFLTNNGGSFITLLGVMIIAASLGIKLPLFLPSDYVMFSVFADLVTVFGIFTVLYTYNKKPEYIHRTPNHDTAYDTQGKNPGIMLLGRDRISGTNVWLSNDDLRKHAIVFGTTGSGKSRFLLSIMYQAILSGSGVLYCDGKADNTVFWLVYSLCRRVGREDDLLVLNYLLSSRSNNHTAERFDFSRMSNTTNPFATGNADEIRSMLMGLMSSGGGDPMWQDRASAMVRALLTCLTYKRDTDPLFMLDIRKIREYMTLDAMIGLYNDETIPADVTDDILRYLLELPGFTLEDAVDESREISQEARRQHGFCQMQLTGVLTDLSSTYRHIFDVPEGEISYADVVFQRRILFVMLPSLETEPAALAALGRQVIAGIRSALAPALGSAVEGRVDNVIYQKPTNSKYPFVMILDEYGFYSVSGFAVVAAQARSLGVSVWFSSQNYSSFAQNDPGEAETVLSNTCLTVAMKNEDQGQTFQIIRDRAGQTLREETTGSEKHEGHYRDSKSTKLNNTDRVNLRDLAKQGMGQAHVIYDDHLIRLNLVFVDPKDSPFAKLNKFIIVGHPQVEVINKYKNANSTMNAMFKSGGDSVKVAEAKSRVVNSTGIKLLFSNYAKAKQHNLTTEVAAEHAIGSINLSATIIDNIMQEQAIEFNSADNNSTSKKEPIEIIKIWEAKNPTVNAETNDNNTEIMTGDSTESDTDTVIAERVPVSTTANSDTSSLPDFLLQMVENGTEKATKDNEADQVTTGTEADRENQADAKTQTNLVLKKNSAMASIAQSIEDSVKKDRSLSQVEKQQHKVDSQLSLAKKIAGSSGDTSSVLSKLSALTDFEPTEEELEAIKNGVDGNYGIDEILKTTEMMIQAKSEKPKIDTETDTHSMIVENID